MIGRKTTRPASKKIGKPKSRAATPRAKGARSSPNRLIRVSASTWAPPVISSSRPSITPKPTSSATDARVLPKPLVNAVGTRASGMPAATAVSRLTSTSAMKACRRTFMIRNSRTATAAAAISSSVAVPWAGAIASIGSPGGAGSGWAERLGVGSVTPRVPQRYDLWQYRPRRS